MVVRRPGSSQEWPCSLPPAFFSTFPPVPVPPELPTTVCASPPGRPTFSALVLPEGQPSPDPAAPVQYVARGPQDEDDVCSRWPTVSSFAHEEFAASSLPRRPYRRVVLPHVRSQTHPASFGSVLPPVTGSVGFLSLQAMNVQTVAGCFCPGRCKCPSG